MASIFSKIIAGEIPCHEVWQDDDHLAFMDIRPVQPGHCLVIPKEEISHVTD
ncbi:MAG: HIT family protein, partial [Planctomycetota bacterium]